MLEDNKVLISNMWFSTRTDPRRPTDQHTRELNPHLTVIQSVFLYSIYVCKHKQHISSIYELEFEVDTLPSLLLSWLILCFDNRFGVQKYYII